LVLLSARQFVAGSALPSELAMHSSRTPLASEIELGRLNMIDEDQIRIDIGQYPSIEMKEARRLDKPAGLFR
jgi:hypothetical protein